MAPDDATTSVGDVLVLNAGSSSLKFALVDPSSGNRHLEGLAERLTTSDAVITIKRAGGYDDEQAMSDGGHDEAVGEVLKAIRQLPSVLQPVGVGHRVVHGGERYADSMLIDRSVIAGIKEYSPLAPLHNPPALLGIDSVAHAWPDMPQVAVFDTAFHQTMPPRAFRYAVPTEWYTELAVRRYGFHGTSHRYVSQRAAKLLDLDIADSAIVVAHLGNGCSAAAVLHGESVDTTMGLTPLEGLVMGTRSGDVDPGLFGYLEQTRGMSGADVIDVLNKKSGLLGLSGRSNDMRTIQTAAARGDLDAQLAVDVFVYRVAKTVAGLVVPLGRLDALVFTGGIGENDAPLRARVVGLLAFLGLRIDVDANAIHGRATQGRISHGDGPTAMVVATDEELMIARDTLRLVGAAR